MLEVKAVNEENEVKDNMIPSMTEKEFPGPNPNTPRPARKRWGAGLLLVAYLFLGAGVAGVLQARDVRLSKEHKKWLKEEVVYIISDDEKKAFRRLFSDKARDVFIEQFWKMRDPNPGTPENEYREEHFKRIEHVNHYFGVGSGKEGWRTDRGRIYIQLGPPKQRLEWKWHGQVRPLELWFYANFEHPSLPQFFNVMFYQKDDVGDYELYSPYLDGPDKLVKQSGTENRPQRAYQFLRRINLELARASMTLRTDEPLDASNPVPSLGSDAMLARISNLPNDRFTKEKIRLRSNLRESVKTRLLADPDLLSVYTVPLWDATGKPSLHFLLTLPRTLKQVAVRNKDTEQYRVDGQASVLVRSAEGRRLFQQDHDQSFLFTPAQFAAQEDLFVSYADRLPLPPGKYEIDFSFYDSRHDTYYVTRETTSVSVPERGAKLSLGTLVPYGETLRSTQGTGSVAFEFFNIRFVPTRQQKFRQSDELKVFFQVHVPPGSRDDSEGSLQVEYTIGSLATRSRQSWEDEIPKRELDANGAVLHGKSFSLADLAPGNYRLVVNVTDPKTRQSADQTFSFRLGSEIEDGGGVVLYNWQFERDLQTGWIDYRRGLGELALGKTDSAMARFSSAVSRNPRHEPARSQLVEFHFNREEYAEVAALLDPVGITEETSEATVTDFLASLVKLERHPKALEVAEQALTIFGPTTALLEELAALYERNGQPDQAAKARKQAQRMRELSAANRE